MHYTHRYTSTRNTQHLTHRGQQTRTKAPRLFCFVLVVGAQCGVPLIYSDSHAAAAVLCVYSKQRGISTTRSEKQTRPTPWSGRLHTCSSSSICCEMDAHIHVLSTFIIPLFFIFSQGMGESKMGGCAYYALLGSNRTTVLLSQIVSHLPCKGKAFLCLQSSPCSHLLKMHP